MNEKEILEAIANLPVLPNGFLDALEKTLNETFFEHYDTSVRIEILDYPE